MAAPARLVPALAGTAGGALGGVLLAFAYALLAGWGVPAQRTVALLLMVAVLQSSGRLWPWPLALLLCALPIALADPWALVQPGFWLSFAAVALLMQQGRSLGPDVDAGGWWRRGLRELLHTQAVVTLGLAPLTVLFFGQLSLVGVLANLVAVPMVTLLLTPLTLLGALLPWAWAAAAAGVHMLFSLLQQLASWPLAVLVMPQAPAGWQLLALLGLLLVALRLPRVWRCLGVALLVPLFLWQPARPLPGEFRLRVFDVGQGSAVWLQTAGHDLLFDAGPRWGPAGAADAGARVLVPALRAAGVRRLDLLLISHGDGDHAGGADSLLAALSVAHLMAPADPRLLALRPAVCSAGQSWTWDGVDFALLHPPRHQIARSANAGSCVLRVRAASGSGALLTGDIEATEEAALLRVGTDLRADLLLLPHHGSASSSSPAFLVAVAPRLAFAQSGYRNRHGHPALVVQTRLRELGLPLLDSASCGAFDWHSATQPAASGCWRHQRRRYWHHGNLSATADDVPQGPPPVEAP